MTDAVLAEAKRRLEAWRSAPPTWSPETGGKRPLVCWEDEATHDLGPDPDGGRFEEICERMLTGRYYPPDVLEFYGDWVCEKRHLRPGDRVLQRARLFGLGLWAMTEIFVAERDEKSCTIGYVTTRRHFGRGIWRATLTRDGGRLSLRVKGTAGPGSFLFWVGLPVARWLMRRAWRRAPEEFAKVEGRRIGQ